MDKFTFQLTQQQLNILAQGLGELPFKIAQPMLQELQNQFDAQKPKTNGAVPETAVADQTEGLH